MWFRIKSESSCSTPSYIQCLSIMKQCFFPSVMSIREKWLNFTEQVQYISFNIQRVVAMEANLLSPVFIRSFWMVGNVQKSKIFYHVLCMLYTLHATNLVSYALLLIWTLQGLRWWQIRNCPITVYMFPMVIYVAYISLWNDGNKLSLNLAARAQL